jgi:hypothetical protein
MEANDVVEHTSHSVTLHRTLQTSRNPAFILRTKTHRNVYSLANISRLDVLGGAFGCVVRCVWMCWEVRLDVL